MAGAGPFERDFVEGPDSAARHEAPSELASHSRAGLVVAVWGPTGAPGRSTVAINVAAELATRGAAVTLADADTYGGSIATMLGLLDESPGFAASGRLIERGEYSLAEFERLTQNVAAGAGWLRVLGGLSRADRWPEVGTARVSGLLEALKEWNDAIVLDVGFNLERDEEISSDIDAPRRNAATLASLSSADVVLAVASADPVGIARFLRGHHELRRVAPDARVIVVVNRLRRGAIGSGAARQISEVLQRFGGIRDPWYLPFDLDATDAALSAAGTLAEAAPRSAIRAAIRELVDAEFPAAAAPDSGARRGRTVRRRVRREESRAGH
ncbi:AAA family ATPase [Ruicaihuangia caeni]|uniref:P-loop NTPase n=1 Tax=Ruicaihuangia caeni TaxID=3042517 RepID=A0AAW6T8A8_9MICO|nr:P-loop NTPase [Klugiella sp. YN-L-19]MDI2099459.1 P-loop NTPase [Klugiella sp. YN-L-19]